MRAPTSDEFARLASGISAASIDPGRWLSLFRECSAAFGGSGTSIDLTCKRSGVTRIQTDVQLDPGYLEPYNERFFSPDANPRVALAAQQLTGTIHHDAQIQPEEWKRYGDYVEWLTGADTRYAVWSKIRDTAEEIGFVCVHFAFRQGFADDAVIAASDRLVPYLINAVGVAGALAKGGAWRTIDATALADPSIAFALLDRTGRVTLLSSGFDHLARDASAITVHNGRLIATRRGDQSRLDAFVGDAISRRRTAPPLPIRLERASGGRGIALRATRLQEHGDFLDAIRPAALLTLIDMDAPLQARAGDLRSLWGLTGREAEIALHLADGRSIDEAASLAGMSGHTARHHLKGIYRRMDIDRQTDLVRLIARLGA